MRTAAMSDASRRSGARTRRRAASAPEARRRAGVAAENLAELVIRAATTADAAAITEMRLALLRSEFRNPLFASPHRDVARRAAGLTRRQLADPAGVVFIALARGRPVGMLRCQAARASPLVRYRRVAIVTSVFVHRSHRRRGLLRSLLEAADRWCRERRLPEMRLHCAVTNTAGAAAWLALGFAPAEVLHRRLVPPR